MNLPSSTASKRLKSDVQHRTRALNFLKRQGHSVFVGQMKGLLILLEGISKTSVYQNLRERTIVPNHPQKNALAQLLGWKVYIKCHLHSNPATFLADY